MREIRTSGSVRGGGGNVPTYSAHILICDELMIRTGGYIADDPEDDDDE